MGFVAELLANPSLKRAVVGGITAALIAGNKKMGLGMELGDIAALVTLAVAFIGQSAMVSIKKAGMDAAAKVTTVEEAEAILNESKR